MLESGLVPWGEGAHRRGGGGIEGVARGKSPFRQRFSFSPSWAMSVALRPGSPLLSSSPLSLDSGSISESDFTWPGPFCANCKALFFVIIIFFFFFWNPKSLDRKIGAGGWRGLFPPPCESHYGLSGPEPTHVCAQTVQLPSLCLGKVRPAVSLEPARRR